MAEILFNSQHQIHLHDQSYGIIYMSIDTYIHRLTNAYIHITGYASDVWRLYNLHLTSVTWTGSVSVVLLCSRGTVAIGNIFSVF